MSEKTPQYIAKTTPDLLLAIFGHADALTNHESYPFTKADKQEAFRAIQTPSPASLMPVPDVVLELNHHDGGNRRFIMIQLPEPTPADSIAGKVGYETVSEVGKKRTRRVIAKLQNDEQHGQLSLDLQSDEDLGFKVFKLAPPPSASGSLPKAMTPMRLNISSPTLTTAWQKALTPITSFTRSSSRRASASTPASSHSTSKPTRSTVYPNPRTPKKLASSTSAWTTASKMRRSTPCL